MLTDFNISLVHLFESEKRDSEREWGWSGGRERERENFCTTSFRINSGVPGGLRTETEIDSCPGFIAAEQIPDPLRWPQKLITLD